MKQLFGGFALGLFVMGAWDSGNQQPAYAVAALVLAFVVLKGFFLVVEWFELHPRKA